MVSALCPQSKRLGGEVEQATPREPRRSIGQRPPSASLRRIRAWRGGVAEWLVEQLGEPTPTLVGIDHGSRSRGGTSRSIGPNPTGWPSLEEFQRHWPTDEDHTYVDFVRDGLSGNGAARTGSPRWRRLTEERAGSAKSVFQFDVQGPVAKSTHAGLPWLRFIRQRLGARVHFWPFDGWDVAAGQSAIAEVYPRLWSRSFDSEARTADQHDGYSVARWLSRADHEITWRRC